MSALAVEELRGKPNPEHTKVRGVFNDPTTQIRSYFWKAGRSPILEPTMYSKILDFEQSMKKDKMRYYE